MQLADIASIYKKKGSRMDLTNDKLLYLEEYPELEGKKCQIQTLEQECQESPVYFIRGDSESPKNLNSTPLDRI